MKLLKLTIYNMASLEGLNVIDFEKEPLKSADLYSIVGETGSGKSTILDAICLALYGLAPRFYNATKISVYSDEQINRNQVLSTDDPRNILRKGTKECFSEVEFLARDGFRYKARWGCSIARTNYSRPLRRLYRLCTDSDGMVCEKEIEIATEGGKVQGRRNVNNGALDNIIGLDYSQFTRTVMLAQNSFANFIKAEDKEKAVLLEKLTGTEFYTSVARKIYDFYKDAESCYNELYNEVKSVEALIIPDDQLQEVNESLEKLRARLVKVDEEIQRNKDYIKWYSDKESLEKELSYSVGLLSKASEEAGKYISVRSDLAVLDKVSMIGNVYHSLVASKEEMLRLRNEADSSEASLIHNKEITRKSLEDLEKRHTELSEIRALFAEKEPLIVKAREELVNIKNLSERMNTLLSEEKVLSDRKSALYSEISLQKDALQRSEIIISESDRIRQSLESHISMIECQSSISDNLRSLDKAVSQKKEIENEITSDEKKISSLQKLCSLIKSDIDKQISSVNGIQLKLEMERKELSEIDIESVRSGLEVMRCEHSAFTELQKLFGEISRHRRNIVDSELMKKEISEQLISLKKEYSLLDTRLAEINEVLPYLEETYNLTAGSGAQELRTTLKENTPCPVCGSLHHPYVSEEMVVESVLRPFREQIDIKKRQKDEIEQKINHPESGVLVKINVANGRLSSINENIAMAKRILSEEEDSWMNLTRPYPQLGDIAKEGVAEDISIRIDELVKKGKELRKVSDRYDDLNRDVQRFQAECDKINSMLKINTDRFHSADSELRQLQGILSQKKMSFEKLSLSIGELYSVLDSRITIDSWRNTYNDKGADVICRRIEEIVNKYSESTANRDSAILNRARITVSLEQLDKHLSEVSILLDDKHNEVLRQKEQILDKERLYSSYLDSKSPDEVETQFKNLICTKETLLLEAERQAKTNKEKENLLEGTVKTLKENLSRKLSEISTLEAQIDDFLSKINKESAISGCLAQNHTGASFTDENNTQNDSSDFAIQKNITRESLDYYLGGKNNWLSLRDSVSRADDEVKRLQGNKEAKEEALRKHLEQKDIPLVPLDILNENTVLFMDERVRLEEEKQQIGSRMLTHNQSVEHLSSCRDDLESRRKAYTNWKELNDILGNANADRFRETAQCFTLHFLVRQANEQLRLLNRRYSLSQVPNSLGIRVIDHDRADEVRNVSSLSGGETFLVSLALALGLSSISSRNINMANLFVDEGFGTLDSNSLNMVIDALSGLQSMQGKKVGVISHTSEMKERIRTQIRVVKSGSSGKSSIDIV